MSNTKTEDNLVLLVDPTLGVGVPAAIGVYGIWDNGTESCIYVKKGNLHSQWEFVKAVASDANTKDDVSVIRREQFSATNEKGKLGGAIIDLSVNGGKVVEEADGNIAMINEYQVNVLPSNYNNGSGLGNKSILGVKGWDGTGIADIPKCLLEYRHRSAAADAGKEKDIQFQFHVDLLGDGTLVRHILTNGTKFGYVTVNITEIDGDPMHLRHEFDINVNEFQLAGGVLANIPTVHDGGGAIWIDKVYNLAGILSQYPDAKIFDAQTVDGGMQIGTVLTSIFLHTAGSTASYYLHHSLEKFTLNNVDVI